MVSVLRQQVDVCLSTDTRMWCQQTTLWDPEMNAQNIAAFAGVKRSATDQDIEQANLSDWAKDRVYFR